MARKSKIMHNIKRRRLVDMYAKKRKELLIKLKDNPNPNLKENPSSRFLSPIVINAVILMQLLQSSHLHL